MISFNDGKFEQSDILAKVCCNLIISASSLNAAFSSVESIKNLVIRLKKCLAKSRRTRSKVYKTTDNCTSIQNSANFNKE